MARVKYSNEVEFLIKKAKQALFNPEAAWVEAGQHWQLELPAPPGRDKLAWAKAVIIVAKKIGIENVDYQKGVLTIPTEYYLSKILPAQMPPAPPASW